MIKHLLTSSSFFFTVLSFAQDNFATVDFFSIGSNRRIKEFTITGDSLKTMEIFNGNIVKQSVYTIREKEKRNKYLLLYVEKIFNFPGPKTVVPSMAYSLFVIDFSEDTSKLKILQEDALAYLSLDECKNAVKNSLPLQQKYFFTYYSASAFKSFSNYKSFDTVDSLTLKSISDGFISTLKAEGPLMANNKTRAMFGLTFLEDVIQKEYIEHHVNPAVTMDEFSKKLTAYHIVLPRMARLNNNTNETGNLHDTSAVGGRQLIAPRVSF